MKFCTDCGSPAGAGDLFCQACGARLTEATNDESTVFGSSESYADTRDYTPKPSLAVISFVFWWLGLIIYAVNKKERPGRASSALKGVIAFFCMLVPLAGLITFIALRRDRRDYARVAGIAAIVGAALGIIGYFYVIFLYVFLIFTV